MSKISKANRLLIRLIKRINCAPKRAKLFLLGALVINTMLASQILTVFFVFPGTTLAGTDISGKTKKQIHALLKAWSEAPYDIRIKDRSYSYTINDVGVFFDEDAIIQEVFAPNRKLFPLNVASHFLSRFIKRNVPITLAFTEQFRDFIDTTVFDFSNGEKDEIVFDTKGKTLAYIENEERYRIDEASLRKLLNDRVPKNNLPLYPRLTKVTPTIQNVITATSVKLQHVFNQPLTVYVKTAAETKQFHLTERELTEMITVSLAPEYDRVDIDVDKDATARIINAHVRKLYRSKDNIVTPKVREHIKRALLARFSGSSVDAITMTLDSGPNTTGTVARSYIEVDISQQTMYLFQDGNLIKSYKVSTGLDYPTPIGQFTILNKAGLGFSKIYDVWLPWWMGFSYSKELNAYFGIHELPYKLIENQTISRPIGKIGEPATGGCVALAPGAAQEVYRFADIGTPVVIYQ